MSTKPQGRTYHRVNQKKSWTEARDYCRNFYTDLISIRSPQEQKRTAKLFTGDTPLWIGLYNNNKRPTAGWKWINGDKFNNDQWRHAELDNSGPRICMAVINDLWFDDDCSQTYQFTCYQGLAVGRKYHRIEQRKNWTEALDYCRAHYTDLLSIRSLEEHTLTSPLFNEDEPRWIGLYNNMRSTAGWKWINGDVFNFTHWHIKVPGDYMESVICVTVRNGQWFGDDCSKTYLFTCYKDLALSSRSEDREYYRIDQQKSWSEARDYCQDYHTDLISIGNPEEQSLMSKLFDGDTPLWIGLYNTNGSADGWKWINGDSFDYAHWRDKEMNRYSNSRICVAMSNGLWFADYCNQTHWFTCYKDMKKQSVPSNLQESNEQLTKLPTNEEASVSNTENNFATDSYMKIETPNRIYYRIDRWKNWTDALFYCRKHYTDLTSVQNQQEHEMIFPLFDSNTSTWIGLYNDKQSSDGWRWTNGDKLNYSQWRNKMSHNKSSWLNCVVAKAGFWEAQPCYKMHRFVCYTGCAQTTRKKFAPTEAVKSRQQATQKAHPKGPVAKTEPKPNVKEQKASSKKVSK
eukprot:gi/632986576/ref/XP_007910316.1/ PREDICTED: C-type mannose receptor 2-like [Callorhinchus milii]